MDLIDPNTLTAESVSTKGAALDELYNSSTYPHDWTEGTGVLASGALTIPAPASGLKRKWLFVQNQSSGTLSLQYEARLANGTTQSFGTILLAPGASAGAQGSSDERGFSAFVPQGIVKVSGAVNAQAAILEIVE